MISSRRIFCFLGALGMCAGHPVIAYEGSRDSGNTLQMPTVLQVPDGRIRSTIRETAMPKLGEGNLARILTRYYVDGLGGPEQWAEVSSLKIIGNLKLDSGDYEFKAYHKKPNLTKMTIRGEERDLMLGYDGEIAWEKLRRRGAQATLMSESEARRFKHSANFGSFLLYPFAEGKRIEYIDTVPTDGNICHHVRVTLVDEYQVDYFIDIRTYLEVKVVNTDLKNGSVNSMILRDYDRKDGMQIARQVESYEAGEWVSTLTVEEVKVNSGVIPWMFKMPE